MKNDLEERWERVRMTSAAIHRASSIARANNMDEVEALKIMVIYFAEREEIRLKDELDSFMRDPSPSMSTPVEASSKITGLQCHECDREALVISDIGCCMKCMERKLKDRNFQSHEQRGTISELKAELARTKLAVRELRGVNND